MKLVILDGYCLNHGDLSWEPLTSQGEATVYDRTPYELIVPRMGDASIMITNKCRIDRNVIDALPALRYIGVLATGYDNIDVAYCKERGIAVSNIPAYSTESVVQAFFGLLIELYAGIGMHADTVKEGEWSRVSDYCYYKKQTHELFGKTLGIIGFGRIGRRIGEVAAAFGMEVLAYARHRRFEEKDFRYATLDELYAESDIISLNCPLTKENAGMINADSIAKMKPSAVIVNTARGGLINEADLADALNSGRIRGAALDVLAKEPAREDNPLLTAKNTVITPHIAWATVEARSRLMQIAADNLAAYLEGRELNRI